MAVLNVAKDIPLLIDMVGGFQEYITIKLMGIGVVVFVIAMSQILLANDVVGSLGEIAKMVAIEVLQREATNDIP